jgi:hypothetical protein
MNYSARLFFISICLASTSVIAEPVYKSVNDKGEVTFSDSPPPAAVDVQQIQVQPAPTESQLKEGQAREQRINSQANEMGAASAQRQQDRQQEAKQQAPAEEVQPVESYNTNYPDRRRPGVAPGRPVTPGRPVHLPARPVQAPGGRR